MLKITLQPSATELRLRLEGRLAGPWVGELRHCWQNVPAAERRPTILDLREVDFVDPEGEALLAEMHRHGVRLEASCALLRHMLAQIAATLGCGTVEERPSGTGDAVSSSKPD